MNKRLFSVLIVIALILSGCGKKPGVSKEPEKWAPELASYDVKPYAMRAIEIIDAYLNFQMNWDEAKEEFYDIFFRIAELDIIERDHWLYSADRQIYHVISDLHYKQSDPEYRYLRDVLCFYIGEPVSGKVYDAEREIYNGSGEKDSASILVKILDVGTTPFTRASADNNETFGKSVSLSFDRMNGVNISDLQSYIESVWNRFENLGESNASISVYYSQFEQPIFRIYISIFNGYFYGCVERDDAPYQRAYDEIIEKYSFEERLKFDQEGEYPDGFEILGKSDLYEFQSIEQLTEAISVASEFAGMK